MAWGYTQRCSTSSPRWICKNSKHWVDWAKPSSPTMGNISTTKRKRDLLDTPHHGEARGWARDHKIWGRSIQRPLSQSGWWRGRCVWGTGGWRKEKDMSRGCWPIYSLILSDNPWRQWSVYQMDDQIVRVRSYETLENLWRISDYPSESTN